MEDRGASAGFLMGKVAVAFAAVTFIGLALSLYSGSDRSADRDDHEMIANAVAGAIEEIERLPGEAELRRELPANSSHFEVVITGELEGGLQIISIGVGSTENAERYLIIATVVNGGNFTLRMENPRELILRKLGTITVELV